MASRLVLVIGDLFVPDRAPVSLPYQIRVALKLTIYDDI